MASRTTFSELSSPPVTGAALLEEYADRMKTLFDASALPLTSVAGTANAVTATLDPPLDGGGLVDGMKFEITWAAANTGGVTLALNGGSPVSVLDASGAALAAGSVGSGLRSLLEYIGGAFRILSPLLTSLGGGTKRYFWQFTASGTWNKPAGLEPDAMVTIEGWGGGGGGGSGTGGAGGGGGGGYARREMRVADLPSSVAVTIGAGGSVNSRGGNTTFGSLLTAYNGGGGAGTSGSSGGGGGGELGQGFNATTSTSGVDGGQIGGGRGAASSTAIRAADALSIWGGGGGGYSNSVAAGAAVYGGGGGAGSGGSSGGVSLRGGNGGASGAAGTAPGGGGGWNAAGARGEVRVWI